MSKIAIVTDSNSGITQAQGKELGIHVIPMPFYINEELFFEDITLTQEQFYQKLADDAEISTSQPSPGDVIDLWENLLKDYDISWDEINDKKVSIITVEQAKGIEFDNVVVIADQMTSNEKYISYTRALDELIVVNDKFAKNIATEYVEEDILDDDIV